MDYLRQLRFRFLGLFRRKKHEADMAEEMRAHVARQVEANVAAGMSPEEARHEAQRQFGHVDGVKEICREEREGWLAHHGGLLVRDLGYAARQLRRSPGFTFAAVATLALGIGGTTAMYSVLRPLLLESLPYEEPDRLVRIWEASQPGRRNAVSQGVFLDWRTQGTRFEGIATLGEIAANLTGEGRPERVNGARISPAGLQLLGARPVLGRLFAPDEEQPGRDKVLLLTHESWRSRFGGTPDIVGRGLFLNGERHEIIGVLPPRFLLTARPEFVIPYVVTSSWANSRGSHSLDVFARLKPGVTLAEAKADLEVVVAASKPLYPSWKKDWGVTLLPWNEFLSRDLRTPLLVLIGAVALVLCIACANVANLLLARGAVRVREMAVRTALGASRGRIIRQLLAESALLSAIGGAAGLLVAFGSTALMQRIVLAMDYPRANEIGIDGPILLLSFGLAVGTGLAVGLVPALQASRVGFGAALKGAAHGSTGRHRLRDALVVGEVALTLVLLVSAGLLLRSLARTLREPIGFQQESALAFSVALPGLKYPDNERRQAFHLRAAERIAALPGVEAAGWTTRLPLGESPYDNAFKVVGRTDIPDPGFGAYISYSTPGYFGAMGIPLLRGRLLQVGDMGKAVISEWMAAKLFPGMDPVGQRLIETGQEWEVVGVVGDVRVRDLTQNAGAMVYRLQSSNATWSSATLVVRTKIEPSAVAESVRRAILELDPDQPLGRFRTLSTVVTDSLVTRRLTLGLLGIFTVVAVFLAALGLYGLLAYTVTQRTREFGIRLALGAQPGAVVGQVLGQGLRLAGLGVLVGLAGAAGAVRLIAGLLYGVEATDPLTYAGVTALLLLVTLAACWLPARRAAKVDPMTALRSE